MPALGNLRHEEPLGSSAHVQRLMIGITIATCSFMVRKQEKNKRWVHKVKTVSTFPPEGTFSKDAASIARIMASKKVSPKGIGSGIRMIQYFINRAGKGLSVKRRKELEK